MLLFLSLFQSCPANPSKAGDAGEWLARASTRQPLPPLEAASRYRPRLEAQRMTHQSKGVIKAHQESPFAITLKSFGGPEVRDWAATSRPR
jgi:hypothetical protein